MEGELQRSEIRSLTGLRFIAALYVFLFHIEIRWPLFTNGFLSNVSGQGAVGMSLFFVLSGFVLAYQYTLRETTYSRFLINRVARIYPVYLFVSLLTLPWIGISLFDGSTTMELLLNIGRMSMLVISEIFLLQAWFPDFFGLWSNGASWSLSVEAFCYLLLPPLLVLTAARCRRQLWWLLAAALMLSALPGLYSALFKSNFYFYHMPMFRLPEFICGVCALLIVRNIKTIRMVSLWQFAAIALFLVYIGLAGSALPIYIGHNWIAIPLITFLVASLSTGEGMFARLLSTPLFVWLGKVSYCFYLLQAPLFLYIKSSYDQLIAAVPLLSNAPIMALACFVVLLACAAATYYFIEEPFRHRIKSRHNPTLKQVAYAMERPTV